MWPWRRMRSRTIPGSASRRLYTSSIALVDEQATRRMARISSHLQELEDHLPLDAKLRGRKLGAVAPILVLDVIYHGGLAGAMVEAGVRFAERPARTRCGGRAHRHL